MFLQVSSDLNLYKLICMRIKKNTFNRNLILFLSLHTVIWTLVPSVTNINLPLDTIEALAWGSDLSWGYNKHPPASAFFVETFYKIFGNKDWVYYFLSQIFVVLSFIVIFKFSEEFFKDSIHSLISVLLLEGIFFYNFTTPEFNVNVCQLPFWALSVFYSWKGFKNNNTIDWLLFGLFAGLGILSKYLFIYLLIGIDIFFIYLIINKKLNFKCLISLVPFLIVLFPHIIWLIENDYTSIKYAFERTGYSDSNVLNHFIQPFIFLGKQIGILIPFFLMVLFLVPKLKTKFNFKDKKLIFLLTINIIPLLLIFLTSLVLGVKIRTMWMTPFYLFLGVLMVYIFKKKIFTNKLKNFIYIFSILFFIYPISYYYISITNNEKKTDYPGKKVSQIVQKKWDKNFKNKIEVVAGDEWFAGNLSYHLKSRPVWDNILENENKFLTHINKKSGIVIIAEEEILSKVCSALFFKVENQGICMIGLKK